MNTPRSHWELKLSSLHAIILIGLVTGSMVASFYLGFLSGERTGFESGQEASMAHTARIPIPESDQDSAADGSVAEEVYDQLAAAPKLGHAITEDEDLPSLGKIETAPAHSLGKDLGATESTPEDEFKSDTARAVLGGTIDSKNPSDSKKLDSFTSTVITERSNLKTGTAEVTGKSVEVGATLGAMDEPRTVEQTNESIGTLKTNSQAIIDNSANTTGASVSKGLTQKSNAAIAGLGYRDSASNASEVAARESAPTPKPTSKPQVVEATSKAIAKKAEEPTGSSSGLMRTILPKGWYAQVAAPKKISEAESIAGKLKRSGFPVLIERANVRGEEYFRIVVGPESDRVQVDRLINQVKREGYEPFPRAVK